MTKLYVSRYSNKELSKTDMPKVGISLGKPKFKIDYNIEGYVYLLAPPRELFRCENKDYFGKKYKEALSKHGIEKIKLALSRYGYGKAEEMILLCFEDVTKGISDWCHRTMFAEWWEEQTGEKVEEYPDFTTEAAKKKEKELKEKAKAEKEAKEAEADRVQIKLF